jgi:hypothetical protein
MRERELQQATFFSFIPTYVFVRGGEKQLHHEAVLEISV